MYVYRRPHIRYPRPQWIPTLFVPAEERRPPAGVATGVAPLVATSRRVEGLAGLGITAMPVPPGLGGTDRIPSGVGRSVRLPSGVGLGQAPSGPGSAGVAGVPPGVGRLPKAMDTSALSFDADDDNVDMGDVLDFPGTAPFTLELWVWWGFQAGDSLEPVVLDKRYYVLGWHQGYVLYADFKVPGVVVARFRDGTKEAAVTSTIAPVWLQWGHVAATYDGSTLRLYLNGSPDGTGGSTQSLTDNQGTFRLGYDYQGANDFRGKVAEVRVWDYARGQDEIQADMRRRLTCAEQGLVGYWPLTEGQGALASDKSTGGNDGIISGATWEETFDQIASGSPPSDVSYAVPQPSKGIGRGERTVEGEVEADLPPPSGKAR